jgi:hypothetical protein
MQNCECPHCHKATITPWQKLFVGVGRGVTCPSCSNELVISWKSLWIVAGWKMSALWFAALAVTGWLQIKYIPLVVKSK